MSTIYKLNVTNKHFKNIPSTNVDLIKRLNNFLNSDVNNLLSEFLPLSLKKFPNILSMLHQQQADKSKLKSQLLQIQKDLHQTGINTDIQKETPTKLKQLFLQQVQKVPSNAPLKYRILLNKLSNIIMHGNGSKSDSQQQNQANQNQGLHPQAVKIIIPAQNQGGGGGGGSGGGQPPRQPWRPWRNNPSSTSEKWICCGISTLCALFWGGLIIGAIGHAIGNEDLRDAGFGISGTIFGACVLIAGVMCCAATISG